MMPNNLANSIFKKPALVLAITAICGLGLAGCNDDNEDTVFNSPPTTPTPMVTGDLIVLTESGQIASVNRANPNLLISTQIVSGLRANDSLVGIDYRPADGKLYGVGALGNLYTLDPSTGVATFTVALSADVTDTTAAFTRITGNASLMSVDFNPVADRLRVLGNDGQNLRINVDTGATTTDGSINGVSNAIVTSTAYTNSFAGTGSTRMFDIDVNQDRLYLQNPPNDGTLSSAASAPLGVNAIGSSGFDIDGFNNMGYAALKVGSTLQLHSINLSVLGTDTAAATLMGNLPAAFADLRGIALKPAMNTGVMVQGLTANNQLVSFSPLTPSMTTTKAITGLLANEIIVGIDYRLRTDADKADKSGLLYGLSNLGNLYMINAETGVATTRLALTADATAAFTGLMGTEFAVDFNPAADRLRVLSNTGQSLRINVDSGVTIVDGAINGVEGAVISAAAYTNSIQRTAAVTTMLYDLDQTSNQLLKQDPPNEGKVAPPVDSSGLGITLGVSNGMDIAGGDNGLVLATNGAGLYRINLMTGVATELAAKIGGATTPALVDLAIMLK